MEALIQDAPAHFRRYAVSVPTLLGLALLVLAGLALWKGRFPGRGLETYSREGHPIAFWSMVLALAALGFLFVLRF